MWRVRSFQAAVLTGAIATTLVLGQIVVGHRARSVWVAGVVLAVVSFALFGLAVMRDAPPRQAPSPRYRLVAAAGLLVAAAVLAFFHHVVVAVCIVIGVAAGLTRRWRA